MTQTAAGPTTAAGRHLRRGMRGWGLSMGTLQAADEMLATIEQEAVAAFARDTKAKVEALLEPELVTEGDGKKTWRTTRYRNRFTLEAVLRLLAAAGVPQEERT